MVVQLCRGVPGTSEQPVVSCHDVATMGAKLGLQGPCQPLTASAGSFAKNALLGHVIASASSEYLTAEPPPPLVCATSVAW